MTGTSSSRGARWAVAGLALVALGLRVFPLLGPDGARGYRVDYDEGVYFSAAAYLLEGVWPYRDFVFVHPPGQLLFLALSSAWAKGWLGVAGAFALSRFVAAVLGAVTTVLVARVAARWDAWGAVLAAAVYATYPEIVQVERGPFLEPLLNLVCVAGALLVLRAGEAPRPGRVLAAGVLAGAAVAIKVWAGLWLVAGAGALLGSVPRREVLRYLAAAAVAALLVVLPFALRAPGEFITQVGLFHLWRPADGLTGRLDRVEQLVSVRHLASPLFALVVLGLVAWRRQWTPVARLAGAAWALTVLAFFVSAAWWSQYNAHLVASEALLAAGLFSLVKPRLRVALALAAAASLALSAGHSVKRGLALTEPVQGLPRGSEGCVFSFEPGWALVSGRLPPRETGPLIDAYAHQLLGVLRDGRRFPEVQAAFAASEVPEGVARCEVVLPSARQARQVADEKLARTHELLEQGGTRAWRRRDAGGR